MEKFRDMQDESSIPTFQREHAQENADSKLVCHSTDSFVGRFVNRGAVAFLRTNRKRVALAPFPFFFQQRQKERRKERKE